MKMKGECPAELPLHCHLGCVAKLCIISLLQVLPLLSMQINKKGRLHTYHALTVHFKLLTYTVNSG